MATLSLIIILTFLCVLTFESKLAEAAEPTSTFIRASCRATTYPSVCVQSLATYGPTIRNNPKQLVITALSVSADSARSAKSFVVKLSKLRGLKPREYAAIKDCLAVVGDSVDRLRDSARELDKLGRAKGPEFVWHMSNLQTWVSAALTDDTTCVDGFSGRALDGKVKSSVKARITKVAQVTSNALALCNQFAGKY